MEAPRIDGAVSANHPLFRTQAAGAAPPFSRASSTNTDVFQDTQSMAMNGGREEPVPTSPVPRPPATKVAPHHIQPKRLRPDPRPPVAREEPPAEKPVTLSAIQRWLDLNA